MICPNQLLDCDAYRRFGSAGDPLMWYISQPAKCGPLTSQFSRLPSEVKTNAPLRVPTSNRTVLIATPRLSCASVFIVRLRALVVQNDHAGPEQLCSRKFQSKSLLDVLKQRAAAAKKNRIENDAVFVDQAPLQEK